jgi:hypothetical protein
MNLTFNFFWKQSLSQTAGIDAESAASKILGISFHIEMDHLSGRCHGAYLYIPHQHICIFHTTTTLING